MSERGDPRRRALWALPPLAVGILVLLFFANNKQAPERIAQREAPRPVRVVQARAVDLTPVAQGYGAVQPERVWAAVAQVSGRVIETDARLRNGEIVTEGTVLFRIDPVDFELTLAQARAELAELEVREANIRSSLAIERRDLGLAQRDLRRVTRLAEGGTASKSNVDTAERTMLAARAAVQRSENEIALVPTQRRVLGAKIAQAERDLANTSVRAPFNLRITDLGVEKHQYVRVGQVLFRGDAIDRVEVVAQIALSAIRKLFIGREAQAPNIKLLQTHLRDFTGFRPLVKLDLGDTFAQWEAEFVRFSDQVDPQTRTVGLVVAVDKPLEQAIPGQRPPLSKGMFVHVLIRGHVQRERIVIPRSAVRAGRAYIANAEQRLEIRPLQVLFSQGLLSVIGAGLTAGEFILVSDPIPAVAGMLLAPQLDQVLQDAMLAAAKAGS